MGVLNNFFWASERDGEIEGLTPELVLESLHSLCNSTPETVNRLPSVANDNNPTSRQLVEHRMVDWVEVLSFVNKGNGKSWKCTTEQCGQVYLIVKINPPFVSSFD